MPTLDNYLNDGACASARAVLGYLDGFNIEVSYDGEFHRYAAEIQVARWENCREQGYVLSLFSTGYRKQLNIAFFEHRNSDNICAVKWEQKTVNSPTIDTAKFGDDVYNDKWDVSLSVSYNEAHKMARWISEQLTDFWIANKTPAKD